MSERMERGFVAKTFRRITLWVVASSVALTVLTFVAFGADRGFGAAIGGLVAVINWLGMRWVGGRLLKASDKGKAIWGTLLAVKMGAILGVVWAILSTGHVDAMGFAIGMSGLVLGILAGAFHLAAAGDLPTAEES